MSLLSEPHTRRGHTRQAVCPERKLTCYTALQVRPSHTRARARGLDHLSHRVRPEFTWQSGSHLCL